MTIGLGIYAFFWQWHDTADNPLRLPQMIDRTADLGVSLFQICDYSSVDSYEPADLDRLRSHTTRGGVRLELGTREASGPRICAVISTSRAGSMPTCCAA